MALRGRVIQALLSESKPASLISYQLGVPEAVVFANLFRLYHLGITLPVATAHGMRSTPEYFWDLTVHAREHSQISPGCYGCRMREIFWAANEALVE